MPHVTKRKLIGKIFLPLFRGEEGKRKEILGDRENTKGLNHRKALSVFREGITYKINF